MLLTNQMYVWSVTEVSFLMILALAISINFELNIQGRRKHFYIGAAKLKTQCMLLKQFIILYTNKFLLQNKNNAFIIAFRIFHVCKKIHTKIMNGS